MERPPFVPRAAAIGSNQLLLTNEDFLNGYQVGHLTYMTNGRALPFSDTSLRKLMMAMLENMDFSEAYCFGYVVGWIVTFASKEPRQQDRKPARERERSDAVSSTDN